MAQLCEDPQCSVILLHMKGLKSHVTSSSSNAGALVKSLFISLKAFSCLGSHSRGPYQTLLWFRAMVWQFQKNQVSRSGKTSSPKELKTFLGAWPRY